MSKKLLALLLAMIMIVGSFTSVLAEGATTPEAKDEKATEEKVDEKKDEKAEPAKTEEKKEEKKEEEPVKTNDEALDRAIEVLKKAGFISGYSADSDDFKVEKNVKRSEFASMIVRAKNLEKSAEALKTVPTGFKDVPTNHWANGYIAVAKQQGFVNGYTDGTFRPDRQISYQDMATMLTIALGKNEPGDVYPAGYIVKAQQLGLFNHVDVPAYTDMATRGDVFKMLYNMITSKEFGERNIVKAIVIENSRVEKLAADEVTVEVLNIVQRANWVGKNRAEAKRGDQHTYKLDKDLKLDTEDLLGKVVDITTTEDDKIVEVKVDNSYKYLSGEITSVDPKKFGLDGTKYTALLDERYASEDERLYRTYVNNRDYKYEDFSRKYETETYDFARATVKNGKIIFIDAYKFYDIAPVAEVKDTAVWYYDDARNAAIVRANKLTSVIFNTEKGYSEGSVKEVVKDDVIHLFKDWRDNYGLTHAIVKKDARIDTELTKTHLASNRVESAVGKDGDYWFNTTTPFKPVYSYEGKTFETVDSRKELEPIVGRKVKMLIAIDGSLQLIESDLQWNDGVNAIMRITSSGDVQYLPSTGAPFWAKEGRGTRYYTVRRDNNKQLNELFDINDIVYFAGEGDEKDQAIRRMVSILEYIPEHTEKGDTIEPVHYEGIKFDYANKKFVENKFYFMNAAMNGKYISVNTAVKPYVDHFRYFEGLHAYYLDKYNNLRQVGDISKFIVDNAKNTNLKAIVYSEGQLKALLEGYYQVDTYNFLSSSNTIANTVIFKDAIVTAGTDVVYAEVMGKDNWTNTVYFRDAQGKDYTVNLNDEYGQGWAHTKYGIGDIVKLHILKATADKDVKEGFVEKVVIYRTDKKHLISENKGFRSYSISGYPTEKYFDNDTQMFNRLAGSYAQVYLDEEDGNFVRVIRYYAVGDPESRTYVLGRIYTNVNQFEVITKETGINKFYKTTPQTKFYSVDEDGKLVKDYGFYQEPMVEFHKDFEEGEIEVVVDSKNPDFALEVIGKKSKAAVHEGYLDAAEDAIKKAVDGEILPSNTPDKGEWKVIADKIDEALKKAGLEGKITRKSTAPVRHKDGDDKDKLVMDGIWATMETVIECGHGVQRTVKTKFRVQTIKEDNEKEAQRVLDLVKGKVLTVQANPVDAESVEKEVVAAIKRADSKITDIEDDTNKSNPAKKYVVKATAKGDDWEVELTVGSGADAGSAKEVFAINK